MYSTLRSSISSQHFVCLPALHPSCGVMSQNQLTKVSSLYIAKTMRENVVAEHFAYLFSQPDEPHSILFNFSFLWKGKWILVHDFNEMTLCD